MYKYCKSIYAYVYVFFVDKKIKTKINKYINK